MPGVPRFRLLTISAYPFWDDEKGKGMPSIYLGQKAFVDAGHEVLYMKPGPETRTYDLDGVPIREFKFRFPILSERNIWLHRLSLKFYWLAFVPYATLAVLRVSRTFRPDVISGQFFHGAPVAWIVGRILGIPNVTRMYGTFLAPWVHSLKRFLRYEEVLAFKIPCAYLIMTNDGTRGDDCARALGVPEPRLKFWRNGVNMGMYDPSVDRTAFKAALNIPTEHTVLLMLCRLERWKGVDRLIAAMPALLAQCPDVTALIVGDGAERAALERQAAEAGVAANVRFMGAVFHTEIARFLNAADIFVSLYHYSNVGNPLLEALCCGKCIVSLDNGATAKLIEHGVTGTLLQENALDRLPDTLAGLVRDPVRRATFEQAARGYAERHFQTWPERMAMEVQLIEELVSRHRARKS